MGAQTARLTTVCGFCEKEDHEGEVEDRVSLLRDALHSSAQEQTSKGEGRMRRRLTLLKGSRVAGSAGIAPVARVTGSCAPAVLQAAGLEELFSPASLGSKRGVCVASVTDAADNTRRSSFKDKAEEVLYPERDREAGEETLLEWLHGTGLDWACKKGLKPESPNQDSFSVLVVEQDFMLLGVYDGHGPKGHDISQAVRESVVKIFMQHPLRKTDTEKAFSEAFLECQKEVVTESASSAWDSGTTCTMAYVDLVKRTLTIAHVGDARGVLGTRSSGSPDFTVQDLTIDHKPNLPEEKARIESADPPGRVLFDGFVNYRVFVRNGMYPGLNMSRALGDILAHSEAGLSSMPDVKTVDLNPLLSANDEVTLVICTDGVWEFIESAEAFRIIAANHDGDAGAICQRLALRSWELWIQDSGGEVCDDITVVCLHLHEACGKKKA